MKKICIVYSKSSGEIFNFGIHECEQSLKMFGNFEEDMSKVFDIVHFEFNDFIIDNIKNLKIDINTKQLIEKSHLSNMLKKINGDS